MKRLLFVISVAVSSLLVLALAHAATEEANSLTLAHLKQLLTVQQPRPPQDLPTDANQQIGRPGLLPTDANLLEFVASARAAAFARAMHLRIKVDLENICRTATQEGAEKTVAAIDRLLNEDLKSYDLMIEQIEEQEQRAEAPIRRALMRQRSRGRNTRQRLSWRERNEQTEEESIRGRSRRMRDYDREYPRQTRRSRGQILRDRQEQQQDEQ